MNRLDINNTIFENIKHTDDDRNEFWYARELMPILEYSKWENFHKVIKQAMVACEQSNQDIVNHFIQVGKMVKIGSNTVRKIKDYHLSRYACYLMIKDII